MIATKTSEGSRGPTDSPGLTADQRVRVLIVDDHELVRSGVRSLLAADERIVVVGEAESCEQALARVGSLRPAIVTVDLRLGGRSGIDLCAAIAQRYPDVRSIVLTSFADDGAVVNAIRAGAAGFLLKTVDGAFLVDSVVRVAAGESVIDSGATRRLMEHIRTPEEPKHPELQKLSELERSVLGHVATGLTNREIAPLVDLSPTTVKNHVSSILHKLGLSTRTEVAVFAVRAGILPAAQEQDRAGLSGSRTSPSGR